MTPTSQYREDKWYVPEMSLLVYMYMTTGGQERGSEGGREGGGREEESEGGRDRRERKEGGERDKSKERWNTN